MTNFEKANLGGTGGEPAEIADNIIQTLKKAHPLMDPGDVLAVVVTFNLKQSAVKKSPDDMRAELVRLLRGVAMHLAS